MTSKPVRLRIAPSPTGDAHVGTARTALYCYLMAKKHGGSFILRIDDTDTAPNTLASEEGVLHGLRWLGLNWDEGPDIGGPHAPYRQSERLGIYRQYIDQLLDDGKAYYCYCTAEELEAERNAMKEAGTDPKYSGKCASLTAEERCALAAEGRTPTVRLKVSGIVVGFKDAVRGWIESDTSLMGDFIILKSNGIPVYNFATVIDDYLMEISHVTRAAEHIANTFNQILIYQALGWEFPEFAHFSIMLNEDRTKMSKRKGATLIGQYAEMGYLPEALLNFLAFLGWSPGETEEEIFTMDELMDAFTLERCTVSNAVFDIKKLDWINAKWIRLLAPEDLAQRVLSFLNKAGLTQGEVDMSRMTRIAVMIQERLPRLDDAPAMCASFFVEPELPMEEIRDILSKVEGKPGLEKVLAVLQAVEWNETAIEEAVRGLQKELGWSAKVYFMALRLAITGSKVSPPLFSSIEVIGREKSVARLETVIMAL